MKISLTVAKDNLSKTPPSKETVLLESGKKEQ